MTPTTPKRRMPRAAVKRLILDLLGVAGRPLTAMEIFHESGLDGPSLSAVEHAVNELAAAGEIVRGKLGRAAAAYRTKTEGE